VRTPGIHIIAAVAENGVIGANNGLPFRLATDLKRFKALTMGKPIIMGRKTYDSIGRALPGRVNIVVTRQPGWAAPDVVTAGSLDEAIRTAAAAAVAMEADALCIIGGGDIYAQAMKRADKLLITHVEGDVEGDTLFPAIDATRFAAIHSEDVPAGEKDSHATRFVIHERKTPAA
jgi:dihydrofolate reductase